MSKKTDYVIAILNARKENVEALKAQSQNDLASQNNELLIVQNKIASIESIINQLNWELTTIDQAIAKIMELN